MPRNKLTRTERINKLRSAIIDWRGVKVPSPDRRHGSNTMVWRVLPQQDALVRVIRWLKKLGLTEDQTAECLKIIRAFTERRQISEFLDRLTKVPDLTFPPHPPK